MVATTITTGSLVGGGQSILTESDETASLPNSLIGIPNPTNNHDLEITDGDALTGSVGPRMVFTGPGSVLNNLTVNQTTITSTGTASTMSVALEAKANSGRIIARNSDSAYAGTYGMKEASVNGVFEVRFAAPLSITTQYTVVMPDANPAIGGVLVSTSNAATSDMGWSTAMTTSMRPPSGTTAQRPGGPGGGQFRYNSDIDMMEGYNGPNAYWQRMSNDMEFLGSSSASVSATIDFTGDWSSYQAIVVIVAQVIPVTDNNQLLIRVSGNGGSTWDAAGTDYGYAYQQQLMSGGAATDFASNAASAISTCQTIGNNNGEGVSATYTFYRPDLANRQGRFSWEGTGQNTTGVPFRITGSGVRQGANSFNGVRFLMNSGNINEGHFVVYGIRRA